MMTLTNIAEYKNRHNKFGYIFYNIEPISIQYPISILLYYFISPAIFKLKTAKFQKRSTFIYDIIIIVELFIYLECQQK